MTIRTINFFVGLLVPFFLIVLLGYASALSAAPTQRQLTLLANNCLQCHANHETGAPQLGNPDDWRKIKAQGEEVILTNIVHGIGGMPPLGYCSACTEEDFRQLLRMMTGLPDTDNHEAGEQK